MLRNKQICFQYTTTTRSHSIIGCRTIEIMAGHCANLFVLSALILQVCVLTSFYLYFFIYPTRA